MSIDRDANPKNDADSRDLIAQTRALRRKVTFWRRTAWLLLGGAIVFGAVFYSRGETRRRECRESLEHYAKMATRFKLAEQHPDILEQQWDEFEQLAGGTSPQHYDLIVRNWAKLPKAGEQIPLAVCRDRHVTSVAIGRHVLMNTVEGHELVWTAEEDAVNIVREARGDKTRP